MVTKGLVVSVDDSLFGLWVLSSKAVPSLLPFSMSYKMSEIWKIREG